MKTNFIIIKLNIPDIDMWAIQDTDGHTVMQVLGKKKPTNAFCAELFIKPK